MQGFQTLIFQLFSFPSDFSVKSHVTVNAASTVKQIRLVCGLPVWVQLGKERRKIVSNKGLKVTEGHVTVLGNDCLKTGY